MYNVPRLVGLTMTNGNSMCRAWHENSQAWELSPVSLSVAFRDIFSPCATTQHSVERLTGVTAIPSKRTPDLRYMWKQCRRDVCCFFRPDIHCLSRSTCPEGEIPESSRSRWDPRSQSDLSAKCNCPRNTSCFRTLQAKRLMSWAKPIFSYSAFGFSYMSLFEVHYNKTPLKKRTTQCSSLLPQPLNNARAYRILQLNARAVKAELKIQVHTPISNPLSLLCDPPHSHKKVHPKLFAPVTWQLFTFG